MTKANPSGQQAPIPGARRRSRTHDRAHRLDDPLLIKLQNVILESPFWRVILAWLFAYGLIGLLFAGLYAIGSKPLLVHATDGWDALSFSFVTQATIGYGDVTPDGWLRLAANLQAVIGTGLNGLAIGIITLRLLKRPPPIRVPAHVAFSPIGEGRFAFWLRYINIDSRPLVDVVVSVFYITDGTRSNPTYDAVGGKVGGMALETVDPALTMALFIEASAEPVAIHDPDGDAMKNDRDIPIHPNMFDANENGARLLLRIRGFHAATGDLFAFSHTYFAEDIVCAPFRGIDNNPLRDASLSRRRKIAAAHFEALLKPRTAPCNACRGLPACPFRHTAIADDQENGDGKSAAIDASS